MGLAVTCEDKVCEVNTICSIDCSVKNPTYKSVYLFNHDEWKITFSPNIVEADIYVKYYGKWRFTNFTKATRFPNIPDDRLYVFVFSRYSTKEFQIRVNVSEPKRIKWDFGILDPTIVSYEYIYENKTVPSPVDMDVTYEIACNKGPCFDCTPNKLSERFDEFYDPKQILCENFSTTVIDRWEDIQVPDERIGIKVDGKTIIGNVNIDGNNLVEWTIPIGDRNLEKCGGCKCDFWTENYESKKGVCKETNLLGDLNGS